MKKILVTGGAGYIGSHTVVELVQAGYQPVIVDNFSNSEESALAGIEAIVGAKWPPTASTVPMLRRCVACFRPSPTLRASFTLPPTRPWASRCRAAGLLPEQCGLATNPTGCNE